MTSSARARIAGGTVRPSTCAVLRLIVDVNEDDRDRARGCLQSGRLLAADADDDGRRQRHQLAGQGGE
jgi:hypothetical protein